MVFYTAARVYFDGDLLTVLDPSQFMTALDGHFETVDVFRPDTCSATEAQAALAMERVHCNFAGRRICGERRPELFSDNRAAGRRLCLHGY